MIDKIRERVEELKTLKEKAEDTHKKALQTLQQCEVDIVSLNAAISELSEFLKEE